MWHCALNGTWKWYTLDKLDLKTNSWRKSLQYTVHTSLTPFSCVCFRTSKPGYVCFTCHSLSCSTRTWSSCRHSSTPAARSSVSTWVSSDPLGLTPRRSTLSNLPHEHFTPPSNPPPPKTPIQGSRDDLISVGSTDSRRISTAIDKEHGKAGFLINMLRLKHDDIFGNFTTIRSIIAAPPLPTAGLPVQNGHVVRREDSRGSLFTDPGTPDSMEVKTLTPIWFRQLPQRRSLKSTLHKNRVYSGSFFSQHILPFSSLLCSQDTKTKTGYQMLLNENVSFCGISVFMQLTSGEFFWPPV